MGSANRTIDPAAIPDADSAAASDPGITDRERFLSPSIGAGSTVADLIQDLFQESSPTLLQDTGQQSADAGLQPARSRHNFSSQMPTPTRQWYLGIDIGTTGISAVLLERVSGQLYPIYWDETQASPTDHHFRLPAVISLSSGHPEQHCPEPSHPNHPDTNAPKPDRCFTLPLPSAVFEDSSGGSQTDGSPEVAPPQIQDFKPALKLGIPYISAQTQQWQPVLQWSDSWSVPLVWIQQALQACLTPFKQSAALPASRLICGALGMNQPEFYGAIEQLTGVILGYPFNWSDTYSFNLREAVLSAGLVDRPEQIFFIEDTIAALLSVLPQETARQRSETSLTVRASRSPRSVDTNTTETEVILQNADWQGPTLILNAGATVTEVALVNLPERLQDLQSTDFQTRSLPFAGTAIDQDIICHLLYPLLQSEPTPATLASADRVDLRLSPLHLAALNLEQLVFPTVGEPDLPNRYRLEQRLESSRSGQKLLEAARSLKQMFQQQSRLTLQLGDRTWTILRQDLGSRILLPYVQRLNRELNTLLQQTSTPTEAVEQVICTGGTASIRAIGRWLHEKFPNATIIQDTYAASVNPGHACLTSCSRVAYGLAALPLHPQVLDITRHQYNDYLLLHTLLHTLPDRPFTFNEIVQILEQQGIVLSTEQGQLHLLALLEGHIPPGLLPTEPDTLLFTETFLKNSDFRAIQTTPLCQKQGDYYRANPYQGKQLQRILETILSHTHQKLDRPYSNAALSQSYASNPDAK